MLFVAKTQMEPMDNTIKSLMGIIFLLYTVYIICVWGINKKLFDKGVNVE